MNYRKTDVMVVSAFVFGYVGGCDCVVLPVFFPHYEFTLSETGDTIVVRKEDSCSALSFLCSRK